MAYEPKTWVCGETITADALNNIEGGIQDALDCCGGGGDCGYSCTEETIVLTEESVTTTNQGGTNVGQISYSQLIDADSLAVTFDGTEYVTSRIGFHGASAYGGISQSGPDFTNYPFAITSTPQGNYLLTQNAGVHNIRLVATTSSVVVSECFEKAVKLFTLENIADAESNGIVANDVSENEAQGGYAFAEGFQTVASGHASHAEGTKTTASGNNSHAEGSTASDSGTTIQLMASGENSHAEGGGTVASGANSHAEGLGTIARNLAQHTFGSFNIADPSLNDGGRKGTYVEIVGNGFTSNNRSNARTLDWSGNESLQGSLTLGKDTADEVTLTASQLKALLALLN